MISSVHAAAAEPADPVRRVNALVAAGRAREALALGSALPDPGLPLLLALAEAADAAGNAPALRQYTDAAAAACRRSLALSPRDWDTHLLKARLDYRLGRYETAWTGCRRVLGARPDHPAALLLLAKAGLPVARWELLERLDPAFLPPLVDAGLATPSNLIALPRPAPAPALLDAGRRTCARLSAGLPPAAPRRVRTAGPLHIGYVSPDFNDHAVAHQIPRVFELHDRTRFRVHAYDIGHDDGSPYRRRILAASDVVRDCRALSHDAAAALIAADGIDVLVDLAGHTLGARPEIFARRPAPLQVAWLGYPATTGAAFIDYLVADATVAAPDLRPHFSESIAYLPHTYMPADDRQAVAAAVPNRAAAGLPAGAPVFCAFHQPYKVEPVIFQVWMNLLRRVPDSVLWLRAREEEMAARLRVAAAAAGVAPGRLVVDNHLLPKPDYLASLGLADLFLDTHFFNGHSSVSDALWAGVPVITWPGDSFAGRVAASILRAAGLGDLVAPDATAYEEIAVRATATPDARAALRARTAAARTGSAFFDSTGFTAALESAYATMTERARTGLPPADFQVPPAN